MGQKTLCPLHCGSLDPFYAGGDKGGTVNNFLEPVIRSVFSL